MRRERMNEQNNEKKKSRIATVNHSVFLFFSLLYECGKYALDRKIKQRMQAKFAMIFTNGS